MGMNWLNIQYAHMLYKFSEISKPHPHSPFHSKAHATTYISQRQRHSLKCCFQVGLFGVDIDTDKMYLLLLMSQNVKLTDESNKVK